MADDLGGIAMARRGGGIAIARRDGIAIPRRGDFGVARRDLAIPRCGGGIARRNGRVDFTRCCGIGIARPNFGLATRDGGELAQRDHRLVGLTECNDTVGGA